jgi:hypothetical protein
MEEQIKIEKVILEIMWFDVFSSVNLDMETAQYTEEDDVEMPFRAAMGFDYEILPDNEFRFYLDLNLKFDNVAATNIRSSFIFFPGENYTWPIFFEDRDLMYYIIDLGFKHSFNLFRDECNKRNAGLPDDFVIIDEDLDEILDKMEHDLFGRYWRNRYHMDLTNMPDGGRIVLICPQTHPVTVTLSATFGILDEILFNNYRFNRKHNQTTFFKYVPEFWYYTLRQKCVAITKQEVALSEILQRLFYICIDCSMQILFGERSEILISTLEPMGFSDEIRNMYVKSATSLVKNLRETNKEYMDDPEFFLNEKIDWNSLIK